MEEINSSLVLKSIRNETCSGIFPTIKKGENLAAKNDMSSLKYKLQEFGKFKDKEA